MLKLERVVKDKMIATVDIAPGIACNLKCKHCYAASSEGGGHGDTRQMNRWQIRNVIKNLVKIGVKKVDFGGGEPLTKFELLVEAIKEFKRLLPNGFCGIVTNGTLINERNIEILKLAGLDQVTISFEGVTKEVNDEIRGQGHFDLAINACKLVKKAGLPLAISITVNAINKDQCNKFPDFAASVNADALALQVIEPRGRAIKYWNEIGLSTIEGLESILYVFDRYSTIYIEVPGPPLYREFLNTFFNANIPIKDKSCKGGVESFIVTSGGDLAPCPVYAYELNLPTYSITSSNVDIDKILREYREFNTWIKEKALNIETCKNCKYRGKCTPCPVPNRKKVIECEWIREKWLQLTDAIVNSRVDLKVPYKKLTSGKLYFEVETQPKPLIINLNEKLFEKIIKCNSVHDIISAGLPFSKWNLIKFLCKLRSHGILEISDFWRPFSTPSHHSDNF